MLFHSLCCTRDEFSSFAKTQQTLFRSDAWHLVEVQHVATNVSRFLIAVTYHPRRVHHIEETATLLSVMTKPLWIGGEWQGNAKVCQCLKWVVMAGCACTHIVSNRCVEWTSMWGALAKPQNIAQVQVARYFTSRRLCFLCVCSMWLSGDAIDDWENQTTIMSEVRPSIHPSFSQSVYVRVCPSPPQASKALRDT